MDNNNSDINWNQVRIDASINIMNAILSSSIMVGNDIPVDTKRSL